jgi:hypothetical protein
MKFEVYQFTEADITDVANRAKDLMLETLEQQGYIKSAEDLGAEFVIVVYRKGWFGKFFDKLMKMDEDGTRLQVLRVVRRPTPEPKS